MKIKICRCLYLGLLCFVFGACAKEGEREPECGNGVMEEGEECDDGEENGAPGKCRLNCKLPRCGDGLQDSWEECDDGNNANGDGCDSTCRLEFVCGNGVCESDRNETCGLCPEDCCPCGDGVCDSSLGETCKMCKEDCCPNCGNGILDSGELCDDGNNEDGDGCTSDCKIESGQAVCGNGIWESGEECDDGNNENGDGCSSNCELEFVCGDAVCDTVAGETCRLCPEDCCPDCGNGILDPGEECDGGDVGGLTCSDFCYDGGYLSCTAWCGLDFSTCTGTGPICGDGKAECGELCDGSDLQGHTCESLGYANGTLACTDNCGYDTSQCGPFLYYYRESFEDYCPPNDWVLTGDWECGQPTSGPGSAFDGANCLATNLSGPYSNWLSWASSTADSPQINLTGTDAPFLVFRAWLHVEGGSFDGVNVKVSKDGGQSFEILSNVTPVYNTTVSSEEAWSGDMTPNGWSVFAADLSDYVGEQIIIRFAMASDSSLTYDGFYIDDFAIAKSTVVPITILTTTPLGAAMQEIPYSTTIEASGGSGNYVWSIVSGSNHSWLSIDQTTGILSGTPEAANIGMVTLTVRVEEETMPGNFDEKTFELEVIETESIPFVEYFEDTCPPADWVLTGDWECGQPTSGPGSAYVGDNCLATNLSGNYQNSRAWGSSAAKTPLINLTGATNPLMLVRAWIHTEGSSYDGLNLKISTDGGSSFVLVDTADPPYNTTIDGQSAWGGDFSSAGWQQFSVDLSGFIGEVVMLKFSLRTDSYDTFPGVYLDNFVVCEADEIPVSIMDGSSLPSAQVDVFYSYVFTADGGSGDYVWSITGGTNHDWLTIDSATGDLYGTPMSADSGPVELTVHVEDEHNPGNYSSKAFTLDVFDVIFEETFESGCSDWSISGDWECGVPTSGPSSAHGGDACLATNLSGNYSNYCDYSTHVADSPTISLSTNGAPFVEFYMWAYTEGSTFDGGNLKISTNGGGSFTVVQSVNPPYNLTVDGEPAWGGNQSSSGWVPYSADLSNFAGESVILRFSFRSDYSMTYSGLYIDDIVLLE